LEPELGHAIVTAGYGSGTNTALTARTPNGKLAVTYIPSSSAAERELTVDPTQFSGTVHGQWFNPVMGNYTRAPALLTAGASGQRFRTPGDNGSQANDWVLVLAVE
jgi:hypothetical protein